MYCPRCGAENDDGNRFCVGCGSALSERLATPTTSVSLRDRVSRLLGISPRARLLSAMTAIALVVAIAAFVALEPSEESVAKDAFLRGTDRSCVAEKERISSLERETLARRPPSVGEFGSVLVTIVAEWRSSLQATPAPPVHAKGVEALESGLLRVLVEAGALTRMAREGRLPAAIGAQAQAVDEATAQVNRAIEQLGLPDCEGVTVGPAGADRP